MSAIHFCIDMQDYYEGNEFSSSIWDRLKTNINRSVRAFDRMGVPTVYVACDPCFTPCVDGVDRYDRTPFKTRRMLDMYTEIRLAIPVSGADLVAYKRDYSLYTEDSVAGFVRKNGYSQVIFSGITEAFRANDTKRSCVTMSAADFARAGYRVFIIDDCSQCGMQGTQYHLPIGLRNEIHAPLGVRVVSEQELLGQIVPDTQAGDNAPRRQASHKTKGCNLGLGE